MSNVAPRAHASAKQRHVTTPASAQPKVLLEKISSVCVRLGCGRSTVYRLIWDGKLRTVKLSARAVRVISADVDALLPQPASH
jgi:excisionase family DNA binding protein